MNRHGYGQFEADLRRLEEGVGRLGIGIASVWDAAGKVGQDLQVLRQGGGGCTITVLFHVIDSGTSAAISGATVNVYDSGAALAGTGTTNASGNCTVILHSVDTYTYSVSGSGYATATGSVGSVVCGGTTSLTVSLSPSATPIHVTGCSGLDLSGASVVAKQSGVTVGSGTTNSSGVWTSSLATGTYDITVTCSRFNPTIFSGTAVTGGLTTTLAMASHANTTSYVCTSFCAYPWAMTLHATLTLWGSFTLTWSGSSWNFSGTANFAGNGTCPAKTGVVFALNVVPSGLGGGIYRWNSIHCPESVIAFSTIQSYDLSQSVTSCPESGLSISLSSVDANIGGGSATE